MLDGPVEAGQPNEIGLVAFSTSNYATMETTCRLLCGFVAAMLSTASVFVDGTHKILHLDAAANHQRRTLMHALRRSTRCSHQAHRSQLDAQEARRQRQRDHQS